MMTLNGLLSDLLQCGCMRSIECLIADADHAQLNNKQLAVLYELRCLTSVKAIHAYCKKALGLSRPTKRKSMNTQKETA